MMCDHWKDYGFDDGGEYCRLASRPTLCQSEEKRCNFPELLERKIIQPQKIRRNCQECKNYRNKPYCRVGKEVKKEFGHRVADLVLEVTHEGKRDTGYSFPRLHSRDAILIKFADRLHNLSRMEAWGRERQEHYIRKSKFWKTNS